MFLLVTNTSKTTAAQNLLPQSENREPT